jgi:hypothetical protein
MAAILLPGNRTMTFPLDDLSPAALETLADLIEERLENPDSAYTPLTWHQSQARQNAARELRQAIEEESLLYCPRRDLGDTAGLHILH